MEKLSGLRVSSAWQSALIASTEVPPRSERGRSAMRIAACVLFLAGFAGFAVWLAH
jgi:ferric-dicitrate binding protein FerR (iron transport regulator)